MTLAVFFAGDRLHPAQSRSCSASCRSICSPCCSAAPRRCCRSSPRTCSTSGPQGLGLLRAAPAVGALVHHGRADALVAPRDVGRTMFARGRRVRRGDDRVRAVELVLSCRSLALAVLGGADTVGVVIRQTLVQLETPDEMRGRVSAVNSLFIGTSNQLGEFRAGHGGVLDRRHSRGADRRRRNAAGGRAVHAALSRALAGRSISTEAKNPAMRSRSMPNRRAGRSSD